MENFSFINLPDEELELKDQFSKFILQMRENDLKLEKQKSGVIQKTDITQSVVIGDIAEGKTANLGPA